MDKLTQTINLQKRKINEFECNQSIRVSPQFDIRGGGDSLLTSNPNDKYVSRYFIIANINSFHLGKK